MALDNFERERVRYHLGYLNVGTAASLQFGIPRPIQTIFLVEQAMSNLIDEALPRVRRTIKILDDVECRLVNAQARLAADQLGELKLRQNEPDLLEREYWRWAGRLADQLGVPLYPYANRFKGQGPMAGILPVRNS